MNIYMTHLLRLSGTTGNEKPLCYLDVGCITECNYPEAFFVTKTPVVNTVYIDSAIWSKAISQR